MKDRWAIKGEVLLKGQFISLHCLLTHETWDVYHLEQQSPTFLFLAPGTGLMEDNFSTHGLGWVGGAHDPHWAVAWGLGITDLENLAANIYHLDITL